MKPFTTTPGMTEEQFRPIRETIYPKGAIVKSLIGGYVIAADDRVLDGINSNSSGKFWIAGKEREQSIYRVAVYDPTTGALAPVISYPPDYNIKPEQMIKGFVYVGNCAKSGDRWIFEFNGSHPINGAFNVGITLCGNFFDRECGTLSDMKGIRPATESERAELYCRVEEQPAEPVKEEPELVKPPLGILPSRLWKEQRRNDLAAAIIRYAEAGLEVNVLWVQEYNGLQAALVNDTQSKLK